MSFRLKTIFGVALIEAALLLLLVFSSIDYLSTSSKEELRVRGQATAEMFAAMVKDALLSTDLATLDSAVNELLKSPDVIYARISDGQQTLVQGGEVTRTDFLTDSALGYQDDGVFVAASDVSEGGYEYGRVEVALSAGRVLTVIDRARTHLSGIALIEMALVALFSAVLGTYLTRGLKRLTDAAQQISNGTLGTQVQIGGRDELATTASAFNEMSRRLAASHHEMQVNVDQSILLSEQLAEKEQKLRTILDTAVDGFVTTDERGVIVDINSAGAGIFGYDREQLIGCNVDVLMPEPYASEHAGYLERYRESGESSTLGVGREVRGLRRDGEHFPVDLSVSEMWVGERRMFVGLVRDLSERKRIEHEARRNEAIRSAVANASLDALVTIDMSGRIMDFNPAAERIFGYQRSEVLGRVMHRLLVPSSLWVMHEAALEHYRQTGEGPILGKLVEGEAMRRSGEPFPAELTVLPIEVGDEILFTAIIRDISERHAADLALRESKKQAEAASEAKSRFLAHMSHEIRSPLNAVLGSVDLLLDDGRLDEELKLYAQTAHSAGKTLLALISDILDFSRIEAGELVLESIAFDVDELVGDVTEVVAFRAREKGVQVASLGALDLCGTLQGDPTRLRQILVNLLDNALKFTPSGAVVLTVTRTGLTPNTTTLRFEVQDSGIGIAKEAQERLFDEFKQVDSSDSTRYGGTGLGLAICQRLAHLMGGDIGLSSEPGKGSRFWVEIPFGLQAGAGSVAEAASSSSVQRVLAVGLHPLIGQGLRSRCALSGCELYEVDTVGAALSQLDTAQQPPYELVLVDESLGAGDEDELRDVLADYQAGVVALVASSPAKIDPAHRRAFDLVLGAPLRLDRLLEQASRVEQYATNEPLPAAQEAEQSPQQGAGHILLAEDSPANQVVATALLRKAGYTVDVADNGRKAVEMFEAGDYDLVLMDMRMPEMDGIEATTVIRQGEANGRTPIVALTANALREDIDRCMAAGMDDYVTKPVNRTKLYATLKQWLAGVDTAGGGSVMDQDEAETSGEMLMDPAVIETLAADTSAEAVPEMVSLFIAELQRRVERIDKGLDSLSLDELGDEAHTIKSCAGTFGAPRLQSVAMAMEMACREGRQHDAERYGGQMPALLEKTLGAFREQYDFIE